MKRDLFLKLAYEFDSDLYFAFISCKLQDTVTHDDAHSAIIAYLDEVCNNSYFSRWTHYGDDLYASWQRFEKSIKW